jgi:hypothetical protein
MKLRKGKAGLPLLLNMTGKVIVPFPALIIKR